MTEEERLKRIAELDNKIAVFERRERLHYVENRILEIEKSGQGTGGNTPVDIAQSFNTGVVSGINFPSDVVNTALKVAGSVEKYATDSAEPTPSLIDTAGFRQQVADTGMTAQPGEEAEGFLPRAAEILGGSVVASGPALYGGKYVLAPFSTTLRTAAAEPSKLRNVLPGRVDDMIPAPKGQPVRTTGAPRHDRSVIAEAGALAAEKPGFTAAIDIASSGGAAFGGEVAKKFTDDPAYIQMAELTTGFTLPPLALATRVFPGNVISKGRQAIGIDSAEGRVARGLQKNSADPAADAARIDPDSPLSPARQTGNARLIQKEQNVLNENPKLADQFERELKAAVEATRKELMDFGGDKSELTRIVRRGQEHIVSLANRRAKEAQQNAEAAINKLGGNATERDLSRIYRRELDATHTDLRGYENKLWNLVDLKSPTTFENAQASLQAVKAERGEFVPSNIPEWAIRSIGRTQEPNLGGLRARSRTDPITLNDVKQVRSRLLTEARTARADGKFEKAHDLEAVANGLLADMSAVEASGVDLARNYSAQLNNMFRKGVVKDTLSTGANSGAGVAPADSINKIFSGPGQATKIEAAITANPDSADLMKQFIKTRYVANVMKSGNYNAKTAQNELQSLEREGIFEIFPNLKKEMTDTKKLFGLSEDLAARAQTVTDRGGARIAKDNNQSLAGMLAGESPVVSVQALLKSENPVQAAQALRRRMGANTQAVQGVKQAFIESLWDNATTIRDGVSSTSGRGLKQQLESNLEVAKAFGMTDAELSRTRMLTERLINAQMKPDTTAGKRVIDDGLSVVIDMITSAVGSRTGASMVTGPSGPGLIMSGRGAKFGRWLGDRLSLGGVAQLAIDIQTDPVLYKALLTRGTAPEEQLTAAKRIIETWLVGQGLAGKRQEEQFDRFKTKPGSANAGVTEQLNLGTQ